MNMKISDFGFRISDCFSSLRGILHSLLSAIALAKVDGEGERRGNLAVNYYVKSALRIQHSVFRTRQHADAFSLVEVLIALFVFMFGILGVLAVFPVAMNSASKTIGQVRAGVLAQSAIAQLQADCRVPFMEVTATNVGTNTVDCALGTVVLDDLWNGYFITLSTGDARWQCRMIVDTEADEGGLGFDRITVCPAWDQQPLVGNEFVITRMGLPSLPSGLVDLDTALPDTSGATLVARGIASTWDDDQWNGYYVTLLDGAKDDEAHLITDTANSNELTLSPGWALGNEPADGDRFVISRTRLTSYPRGTVDNEAVLTLEQTNLATLYSHDLTWVNAQWNECYIRILDGPRVGEVHRITATTSTRELTIDPGWSAGDEPDDGDSFVIFPSPYQGFVREISTNTGTFDSIHAGIQSNDDVIPLYWPSAGQVPWHSSPKEDGTCPADSGASDFQVEAGDENGVKPGYLVAIGGDPGTNPAAGQVRLITSATGVAPLNVFPAWREPPSAGDTYEIHTRLSHFLVITTGRAAGRVFPIQSHSYDVKGDKIVCKDVDFTQIGVKASDRGTGANHTVQNATGFMIVGSDAFLATLTKSTGDGCVPVYPVPGDVTATSTSDNYGDYSWLLNSLGRRKTVEPQTGLDFYYSGTTDAEASEYSSVCVFSPDAGLYQGPVRVDVFVFRNFDNAKYLYENTKPVGHVTGYVGRP